MFKVNETKLFNCREQNLSKCDEWLLKILILDVLAVILNLWALNDIHSQAVGCIA